MADDSNVNPTPQNTPEATPTEKTYTQTDIDNLNTQIESLKESSGILDKLYENPRFGSWIEQEQKRELLGEEEYSKLYGQSRETPSDTDDDLDPRISALQDQVRTLTERLAGQENKTVEDAIKEELKTMQDTEKYPIFDKSITVDGREVPVRQLMQREMAKAIQRGQDLTMDQAYRIVTYDYQRELGRKDTEETLQRKREAARVGLPVTAPGRKASDAPKKYDNPRQAVEDTLDALQL